MGSQPELVERGFKLVGLSPLREDVALVRVCRLVVDLFPRDKPEGFVRHEERDALRAGERAQSRRVLGLDGGKKETECCLRGTPGQCDVLALPQRKSASRSPLFEPASTWLRMYSSSHVEVDVDHYRLDRHDNSDERSRSLDRSARNMSEVYFAVSRYVAREGSVRRHHELRISEILCGERAVKSKAFVATYCVSLLRARS